MGFTKLDEGILQSSIMAEDPATFKVWIALLATCKEDGIAHCSPVFLSSVCRLSEEAVDQALQKLMEPDPQSRSKEKKGRRIRIVDGGFFVLNYEKYRSFNYSLRTEAVRKREYRKRLGEKAGQNRDIVPNVPGHSASASASSSLKEGDRGGEKAEIKKTGFMGGADGEAIESEFKDLWDSWPMKKDKDQAFINYRRERRAHTVEELEKAVDGYEAFLKSQRIKKGFDQTPLYLSTFLNKNRWKEYLDEQYFPSL